MHDRLRVVIVFMFAVLGSVVHYRLYALEALSRQVDRLETTSAHYNVGVYSRLARAYLAEGQPLEARRTLEKALMVDSWDFENQLLLAQLETDRPDQARDRLRFIASNCRDAALLRKARELDASLPAASPVVADRPSFREARLRIVPFQRTSPAVIARIQAAIEEEFGLSCAVDRADLEPSLINALRSDIAEIPQLDVQVLLEQLAALPAPASGGGPTLGVLGIVAEDIHIGGAWRFGVANMKTHLAVMSYARFNGQDVSDKTFIERAAKQAFSSAGMAIGINRCTNAECARAYPNSLDEHDRKPTRLCAICRARLVELYARLRSGTAAAASAH